MSDPRSQPDDTEAEPLSPEAQAIFQRARRSFAISMGLLIVGLMTVAGVLVYRVTRDDGGGAAAQYSLPAISLPTGSEIISASASGGILTLTYRAGPVTSIRIFDGRTGEMLREVPIVSE